jgi:hypothetical protein
MVEDLARLKIVQGIHNLSYWLDGRDKGATMLVASPEERLFVHDSGDWGVWCGGVFHFALSYGIPVASLVCPNSEIEASSQMLEIEINGMKIELR